MGILQTRGDFVKGISSVDEILEIQLASME